MLNNQIPMKQELDPLSSHILVHSVFPTIQGEGIFAGEPCVFVRLGGCNLQCPQCDTEYTEGSEKRTIHGTAEEVSALMPKNASLVVITGGEPFRQSIGTFVSYLNWLGYRVQIETNGTLFDPEMDFKTGKVFVICSPKTGAVNKKLQPHISAYKYVGGADESESGLKYLPEDLEGFQDHSLMEDGLPRKALGHTAKPHLARPHAGFKGKVYLQPIDRQHGVLNELHQQAVVNSCLANGYTLCLQIHKIIDVA